MYQKCASQETVRTLERLEVFNGYHIHKVDIGDLLTISLGEEGMTV